jgi:aminoglycoside phosphotransferase family enzyme
MAMDCLEWNDKIIGTVGDVLPDISKKFMEGCSSLRTCSSKLVERLLLDMSKDLRCLKAEKIG